MRLLASLLLLAAVIAAGCAKPIEQSPATTTTGAASPAAAPSSPIPVKTDTHDFTAGAADGTPAGGAASTTIAVPDGVTTLNVGKFPILAALGAILCAALAFSLSTTTIILFFLWMGVGLMVYSLYGIRKSHLHGHVGRGPARMPEIDAEIVLEELPPSG